MKQVHIGSTAHTPTKVIAVGKNFAEHAREMGGVPPSDEPVIFLKPNSAIVQGVDVVLPLNWGLVHHEVELCVLVGSLLREVTEEEARCAVAGWAVGLDLTLRDRQAVAKKEGHPWALSKGFDGSCVLGEFVPGPAPSSGRIRLSVNGVLRQDADLTHMLFSPARVLSFVSGFMTIEPGDLLMCGTPAGVGPLVNGDRIEAGIEGAPVFTLTVHRP